MKHFIFRRCGFSLLEMMISMVAGLAIILVAMAGYRAASSAMAAASRMADETTLIATGMQYVYHEIDHWNLYDDPTANLSLNPERQALRNHYELPGNFKAMYKPIAVAPSPSDNVDNSLTKTSYTFGLPFSPFSATWGNACPSQKFGGLAPHNPSGWLRDGEGSAGDHEDEAWAISAGNPLTWWTANVQAGHGLGSFNNRTGTTGQGFIHSFQGIVNPSVERKGYYSIFGVSGYPGYAPLRPSFPSLDRYVAQIGNPLYIYQASSPAIPGEYRIPYGEVDFLVSTNPQGPYGDVISRNTINVRGWIFNQIRGVQNALGFYGMLDYLPAGMIPAYPVAEASSYVPYNSNGPEWANAADVNDWDNFPAQLTYGYLGSPYVTKASNGIPHPTNLVNVPFFNLCASETLDGTSFQHRGVPSVDRILYPGGFSIIPWCNEWDQYGVRPPAYLGVANPFPLVRSSVGVFRDLVHYHRSFFSWGDSNEFTFETAALAMGIVDNNLINFIRQTRMYYDLDANGMVRIQTPDYSLNKAYVDPDVMSRFLKRTTGTMRLAAVRPSNWPDVSVSVSHHVRMNKYINTAKVGYFDPVSNQAYDLRFSVMGTTLRGARRQRQLDNQ